MALSSDELIKREIIDKVGEYSSVKLRIFPQSSSDDQLLFSRGGLTFGINSVSYGSCDSVWYVEESWTDPFNQKKYKFKPIIALEGTDALNRRSSGNAQYQRFHHALGAVKSGITGIYYLRKGSCKIQEDLYGMAYFASKIESGNYLIIDDLKIVKDLIKSYRTKRYDSIVTSVLNEMYKKYIFKFNNQYKGSLENFAKKRSTIIKNKFIIKHAGRMKRNFTDSSQRAGHIAVGEMYLSKYLFVGKKIYYLFPKMTKEDLDDLDEGKKVDKEWYLLRNEPKVQIKTIDDIRGLPSNIRKEMIKIKDRPLKGETFKKYSDLKKIIIKGLENEEFSII